MSPSPGGWPILAATAFLSALPGLALYAAAVRRQRQLREDLAAARREAKESLSGARERLLRRAREARALTEIAQALTPGRGTGAAGPLGAVVSIVAKYFKADMVAILLLDETTGELVTQAGAFGLDRETQFYRLSLSDEGSSSVRVFKSGEPFLTGDAQKDPAVIGRYAKLWDLRSLMVIALGAKDRPVGVLRIGSLRPDIFSPADLKLARAIADELSVLIETAILNRDLSRATEQLEALNRIKDEFVSTVSHEFRTPLTTVSGFLGVVLEEARGSLTETQRRYLSTSLNASKKLEAIVRELLDLSLLEGGTHMLFKPFPLGPLIEASLDLFRTQAEKGGKKLSADFVGELPPVHGDHKWIRLVLDNLISNALKFAPAGGEVSVSARDKGEFVLVSVKDGGIGIPKEESGKIFEKFFRASNSAQFPGTGLGLALCREVISRHGGKIWFESSPGRGSSFHFLVRRAGASGSPRGAAEPG